MFRFTLLFIRISMVFGSYFTMKNVTFTIYDKHKLMANQKLLTLYAQGEGTLTYNNSGSEEYIGVTPVTGIVYLKDSFTNGGFSATESITSVARVTDASNEIDFISLMIHLSAKPKSDCSNNDINQNICFWTEVTYEIKENSVATMIGSLSSDYSISICPKKVLEYKLETDMAEIELLPPHEIYSAWSIVTKMPLNRNAHGPKLKANVTCTIRDFEVKTYTRLIEIDILDIDNYPPTSQHGGNALVIQMDNNFVKKGYEIHPSHLLFLDKDSETVNKYNPYIITQENENFLLPICTTYRDPREKEGTAIHCKILFQENKHFHTPTYNFTLILNDTSLKNKTAKSEVAQYITLVFKSPTQAPKSLLLYPDREVKIFKTAAPYARITQPKKSVVKLHNFTLEENFKESTIFKITQEGIVYVSGFNELRKAPEFIKLRISWFKKNITKYDDIEVRIINESNETCKNITAESEWTYCAHFKSFRDCVKPTACAVGTGGSFNLEKRKNPERCMWRGDKQPGNQTTNYYSTCTPNSKYCPDGNCDSLEAILEDEICPQDCTRNNMFPTQLNQKTHRGIDTCAGVLYCQATGCSCDTRIMLGRKNMNNEDAETDESSLNNQTEYEKLLGVDRDKCGISCILGIIVGVFFLIGAAATLIFWRITRAKQVIDEKYSQDNQEMTAPLSSYIERNSLGEALQLNFRMAGSLSEMLLANMIKKHGYDTKWEFPRSQLIIEQTLGEGEFGRVLKARAFNVAGHPGYSVVAVKTLKDDAGESELNDLLSEYQLLKEVSNKNVIRLLGVCTTPGGPPYLIIEFAEYGSLRNYLRKSRHTISNGDNDHNHYDEINFGVISSKEILSFAWQICNGMSYLSDLRLVHRDLAARNVLLAADKICKISDFGLTRDIYEDNAYFKKSKGRVPVKWMAPESLADHLYTSKSDVWSFGILIWELVTLGATPYPGIAVQNLYNLLLQGYRMEMPPNCPPSLYGEMRKCWQLNPAERPSFQELSATFEKMLSDKNQYLDLTDSGIINKSYFSALPINETDKPPESTVNFQSHTQPEEKHASQEKRIEHLGGATSSINNIKGYETPVKRPPRTPDNESPEEYTRMGNRDYGNT